MKEDIDDTAVTASLFTVVKGASIIFISTIIGTIIGAITRMVMVRYITQTEYGLFNLGFVIFNIIGIVSLVGLHTGIPRFIAYYHAKNDVKRIRGVIKTSFQITIVGGIIIGLILFLLADVVANIFNAPDLTWIIRIFSIAIPFQTLITVFTSILQGFNEVKLLVFFRRILFSIIFLGFLFILIVLEESFRFIIYAYTISLIIVSILCYIYFLKKVPISIKGRSTPIARELMIFSLPLLGSAFLYQLMQWSDTLLLGYYTSMDIVGLYNSSLQIALFFGMFMTSVGVIYLPVATQLFSLDKLREIKRFYAIITKWGLSISLPIFMVSILFPRKILEILFGPLYMDGDVAMQIILLGYFIGISLGPSAMSLKVIGETKFLMWVTLIAVITNIALDVLLIPTYSLNGAAIAVAVSYAAHSAICTLKLYSSVKVHPFTKNYLKPIVFSMLIMGLPTLFLKHYIPVNIFSLLVFVFIFICLYFVTMLLTRSFDNEDILLLTQIEKRIGYEFKWFKKVLTRFSK